MKKKSLFLGCLGIVSIGFTTIVSADDLSTSSELGFDVSAPNGKLEILATRPLTFGNIEYSTKEQVVYPYIQHIDSYNNSFAESFLHINSGISGGNWAPPSIIDISDSRIDAGNWELYMTLSDAFNSETGSSFPITFLHKNFSNALDSDGKQSIKYQVVPSGDVATNVYEGSQGAYALSLFHSMKDAEVSSRVLPMPPQTTDFFALLIPANTKIDREGAYSATINWTLADLPNSIPVQ